MFLHWGFIKRAAIAIAVIVLISYWFHPSYEPPQALTTKWYESGRYGLSFAYPADFDLHESDMDTVPPKRHRIEVEASDGRSVDIDIYENEPEEYVSAANFVQSHPETASSIVRVSKGYVYVFSVGEAGEGSAKALRAIFARASFSDLLP